ncbi:MAG: Asp23/Gls24 family envelope stress response protein [Clostridiales bacterium]|nr:Asp23/Gls24 family envelope stress response protein [Clostridiales bacterium]
MKVINRFDGSGRLVYSSEIIRDIVDCALGDVDGVVKYPENSKQARDSIKVDVVEDEMYIEVYVKLAYNVEVSDVASSIQSTVKNAIENNTEFKVKDINVHVIDVEFDEN